MYSASVLSNFYVLLSTVSQQWVWANADPHQPQLPKVLKFWGIFSNELFHRRPQGCKIWEGWVRNKLVKMSVYRLLAYVTTFSMKYALFLAGAKSDKEAAGLKFGLHRDRFSSSVFMKCYYIKISLISTIIILSCLLCCLL